MKKAFTMIELVFVIVILGILASVAISKLSATRDDAMITVCTQNIRTAVDNLINYTTAKGTMPTQPYAFTDVNIEEDNTTMLNLTYSGGTARFRTYDYYCGRKSDRSKPPSALLFALQLSKGGSASVSLGNHTFPVINYQPGEIKVYVVDTNSSYPLDHLLSERLNQTGLSLTPFDTGTGLKVTY